MVYIRVALWCVYMGDTATPPSLLAWLSKVRETYISYDGMFLCFIQTGEAHIWPPSLTFYPSAQNLATQSSVFVTSLDKPSFFRVCARCVLPYFGYAVPSSVHNKLYQILRTPYPPEHVTLFPLMSPNHHMRGILYMECKHVPPTATISQWMVLEHAWGSLQTQFQKLYW